MTGARAPRAPGRLGEALDPALVQGYLQDLATWVRDRRSELDRIDQAAMVETETGDLTPDVMLSMALWKAVSDRYTLLSATWDGGRVGTTERERLSSLIWGRLDATLDRALLSRGGASVGATSSGLAVSLPEACRLSDALAGQLLARLALAPSADVDAGRIREARAALERLRDQVALEPPARRPAAQEEWERLDRRLADVVVRAGRGADVGGLLGPLERDLAVTERDLIVGNARRRGARDRILAARELHADLSAREAALAGLAESCVATVSPSPRYAVPDVSALGPVPGTERELGPYLRRLDRVAQALSLAQEKYAGALAEHEALTGLLGALEVKAAALGFAGEPDVETAAATARDVVGRRPTPMPVARQLVAAYQVWLDWYAGQARPDQPTSRETA